MKLKHLEEALQPVKGFTNPVVELEQYITSPHLASHMIHAAAQAGDIEGLRVGDFGCGTGMLSIASGLLDCSHCVGFDVHADALSIARENITSNDMESYIDLVQGDIQSLQFRPENSFDTIVTNPPFGTRNRGIDTLFIEKAMACANVVYSLHKRSTRDHFVRRAAEHDWHLEMVAELRYDLPKTHVFHKQKSKDIEVDLYRFSHQR